MGWILLALMLGIATWNFFVGMGIMAGIMAVLSVWLFVELLLKSYHQDGYHYY